MKKISYLILAVLFIFAFSCKETSKKTDPATDDYDADASGESSSGISCDSVSVQSGSGSCDGMTCTFNNASSTYSVKVNFSGVSSARSILTNKGEDSSLSISNATNSSYFVLTGTTPSKEENSYQAEVIVRNYSKCKESKSASTCNVSGYDTAPSGADSSWDETCYVTIQTSDDATSNSSLSDKAKWYAITCQFLGIADEKIKEVCNEIKKEILDPITGND